MSLRGTFEQVEEKLHGALVLHSITALRITVGAVFLGFGALKFFPGVSPAPGWRSPPAPSAAADSSVTSRIRAPLAHPTRSTGLTSPTPVARSYFRVAVIQSPVRPASRSDP
jgi:hypothetical protein